MEDVVRSLKENKIEQNLIVSTAIVLLIGIILTAIVAPIERLNILFKILIFIAYIALGIYILKYILKKYVIDPLKALEDIFSAFSRGEFNLSLDPQRINQIGPLGNTIQDSLLSIKNIFSSVGKETHDIASSIKNVQSNFDILSDNTKHESEAITNIAISLEQMNSAAIEISKSAESLAISAEEKAASVEEMVSSISNVANNSQELSNTIDSTSASIEELSASIKEVANKAEELISASEETLTAAEEIASSIKEVEQSAKESATLSEKVKNEASTFGMTSVEKTIEGIKNIKASFDKTADIIKKLGVRSAEIGKILNVIDEITDQTTLLALNAAILAAQAGEHGRGFSVVADEIKDLAERTSFSTKEISELIQTVQNEVKEAIRAMDEGLISVEEGMKVARNAGEALHKIVESSIQSAEMSISIERSTAEQAKTTKLVSESMERVKNMISQVANATIEQSKGALLLTKATERVKDVANHLKTATNEQLINMKLIYDAVELVSDKSRQIARAVNEQRLGAQQIYESIEKVKNIPNINLEVVSKINQSLNIISENAELISKQIKNIIEK
jgi:methyl-accepting chemotaxis protein